MSTDKKRSFLDRYFGYTAAGSSLRTEITAGVITFFAMAYILFVNPTILAGNPEAPLMNWGAVFLATIIASIIGTLIMGLVANVPFAQAPGMGINAFFTYTVCYALGFSWQQALSMVFLCGIINILITVTKLRKYIIQAIPLGLQHAIGGGIGLFIAYIGLLNVGIINFDSGVPGLATLNQAKFWVFLIGMALVIILHLMKVKGAMLIAIVVTALIGIPFGVTTAQSNITFMEACQALPETFGVIFTDQGIISLFADPAKLPMVFITIFAFSITDTFDSIGTFIGTGRQTEIFSLQDEKDLSKSSGFKTKMDKALFADATATSIGAIFGTSNTTTFVESAAGIGAGARTGLASVVTAVCFAISALFAPVISAVPYAATAPVLVMVGIIICRTFRHIDWDDLEQSIPAFFAGIFMAFCYSISYGIAAGFIAYCLVKICRKKIKEIHPVLWVCTILFILNFVMQAAL